MAVSPCKRCGNMVSDKYSGLHLCLPIPGHGFYKGESPIASMLKDFGCDGVDLGPITFTVKPSRVFRPAPAEPVVTDLFLMTVEDIVLDWCGFYVEAI